MPSLTSAARRESRLANFERDAAVGDGARPAAGRRQAAEREEMRDDVGRRRFGERADRDRRAWSGEHLPHQAGAARQRLRRGAHAAAAGIAHQRPEARRPGKPDAHAVIETEAAQPRDEIEDR